MKNRGLEFERWEYLEERNGRENCYNYNLKKTFKTSKEKKKQVEFHFS